MAAKRKKVKSKGIGAPRNKKRASAVSRDFELHNVAKGFGPGNLRLTRVRLVFSNGVLTGVIPIGPTDIDVLK